MSSRSTLVLLAALVAHLGCDAKQQPPQPPVADTPPAGASPPPTAEPEPACNHLVLIDASSSSSRAYTFEIERPDGGGLPTAVRALSIVKTEPGLASFKGDAARAGASIAALLAADDGPLKKVPEKCRARTAAGAMATAGMRNLESEEGGQAAADAIFAAVKQAMADAGFDARFAGTISGQQEALYGWITANHLLGHLTGDGPTVGALDLGGASTEIAFVPADAAAATISAKFGDKTFAVYAMSYGNYGQDVARRHLNVPPCDPKGLGKGTGKYGQCVSKLEASVKARSCPGASCGLASPGDPKNVGVVQPKLPEGMKFYATSAYHYTRKFLELPEQTTPAALREAAGGPKGGTGFCGLKWADITAKFTGESQPHLETYCFSAAWIDVLLRNYGFAPTTDQITFSETIGGSDAGWAVGAALCSVTGCLQASPAAPAPAPAAKPAT